jgi:hypothetical protein
MKIGMLWFDNDPKVDLEAKLKKAFEYYQKKYKKSPNLVWVHPTMLALSEGEGHYNSPLGLTVKPNRSVMPDHFWVGVEAEEQRKED